jgi:hypothetical protein
MSQRYAKWWLDSCEIITHANNPFLLHRGGLWALIVRGDDVVRGDEMEVNWKRIIK